MSGTGGYDNRQGLNWMRGVKMRDDIEMRFLLLGWERQWNEFGGVEVIV